MFEWHIAYQTQTLSITSLSIVSETIQKREIFTEMSLYKLESSDEIIFTVDAATVGLVDEFQKWVTLESNESFWA